MISKIKHFFPPLLWMSLIFFLSSRPTITTSIVYWHDFILKKTAHLIEYFILTCLLYRSLSKTMSTSFSNQITTAFFISGIYAISDEIHQIFVPGRTSTFRDVVIDFIGSGLAVYCIFIFTRTKPWRQRTTG